MGSRTLAVATAWFAVALHSTVPAMALGSGQDQRAESRRIRAANSASASLVPAGLRRSETFRDERLAVLGHELQHVREVAADPDTVDLDGMRRLFEKIGDQISPIGDLLETRAAQTVEQRIRVEMERRR